MNFNKTIRAIPGDRIVKIFADLGIRVTGRDLFIFSAVCAAYLQKAGYRTITIHMGNCPEFLYLFAGAMRAGVTVRLANVLKECHEDTPVFDRENTGNILNSLTDTDFEEYVWGDDETLIELYTSGTSGSKSLERKSFKDLFGIKDLRKIPVFVHKLLGVHVYNASPWYHAMGVIPLYLSLAGIHFTEITSCKFNPDKARVAINESRPQLIVLPPSMLARIAMSGPFRLPAVSICSGETLDKKQLQVLEKCGGVVLANVYGCTAITPVSCFLYMFKSAGTMQRAVVRVVNRVFRIGRIFDRETLVENCGGSVFRDTEVIITEDGAEVPDGAVGRIYARARGNAGQAFIDTGDVGYKQADLLFIKGRSTNVINRSGEKISPSDIENAILQFDGVTSVFVFGTYSETHGEDICAAVECAEGSRPVDREALSKVMPKYMIPQHIVYMKSFPLTATGKTDLNAIKQAVQRELEKGHSV